MRCVITPSDARPVRVPNVHSSQCDAHTFISRNPAQPASQANRKSFLFLWYTFSVTKAVEWQRGFSLAGGYRFVTTHKYLSARRREHLNDLTLKDKSYDTHAVHVQIVCRALTHVLVSRYEAITTC